METGEITLDPPKKLQEILIRTFRGLQMLPDVAIQAIAITDNPDARIEQLVSVIAQDAKLTADMLVLSNCSLFGSAKPALTLRQAIMRLGFQQTKSLILASSIASMMKKMPWKELRIRDSLCEHSLWTANLCSRLNGRFKLGMQGEEFTAGLIHDFGRTLLAVALPEEFSAFDPLDFNEPDGFLDREINEIGTTHAEVGAWFIQQQHLPDELVTVARYHHAPNEATDFKRLVAVTTIADELANFCQRNRPGEKFDCSRNQLLMESLGIDLSREILPEFINEAKEGVDQMLKFT